MIEQPSGTVTLVFTDVEGSTRLLEQLGVEAYREALAEHRRVVREACARHDGYEVDTEGDAFFYAFATAQAAVSAMSEAMAGLDGGPIRIRVGIHTGQPALDPPKYLGIDVHRAARIMASAHGGQVVLSRHTAGLLDSDLELKDLGNHRFKDFDAPERIYQLGTTEHPPLKSLYRLTLPVPATPFLGRDQEVAQVVALLTNPDTRLLTLTGPGGTGKTRLAIQAAAQTADTFPDGTAWIPLAPLRDPTLVIPTIAQALELREQTGQPLTETIAQTLLGKQALLLLDNAEHLLPQAAEQLSALLQACPTLNLLVTSRERLRISAETSWPVPQLAEPDGERLFLERARAAGVNLSLDDTVRELCRRLDQLPLAIELAAARTPVLTPAQIHERLGQRLDLFKGQRDTDPRQHTLRATIDWSYELLDSREKALFEAMSVFVDGCLLDAVTSIAEGDLDDLQSLIDKSLVRRRDSPCGPRYWMLETIRDYASEHLTGDGRARVSDRHAAHYAESFARIGQQIRGMDSSALIRADQEAGNIRLGIEHALRRPRGDLASLYLYGLWPWLIIRGALHEAGGYAKAYLELDLQNLDATIRFAGDLGAGELLRCSGEWEAAIRVKRATLGELPSVEHRPFYGEDFGAKGWSAALLTDLAHLELETGEIADAQQHAEEALALRRRDGRPWGIAHALKALVAIATETGRYEEARELERELIALVRAEELIPVEVVFEEIVLAELELLCGRPQLAARELRSVDVEEIVRMDDRQGGAEALRVYAACLAAAGANEDAALLIGAFQQLTRDSGIAVRAFAADQVEALVERLRRQMGQERFAQVVGDGERWHAMDLVAELAQRLARALPAPAPGPSGA